ncbi:hypothetical protein ZIOFF_040763 [Zingiber officinale]|uniref:AT-hook motif nuclear-localized protein n=1 Tax=Zingiber officinale TaxID=94328 RepID=A0A8J5G6N6_ZINOF|nr:hypothetical protein ZIOFF_040763 [Zingiber officinale]
MDGREAMAMPGVVPYYLAHRGIPSSLAASQPGLHLAAHSLSIHSSGVGSGAFQVESPPAASAHGGGGLGEGGSQVEPVKRKRGRPRKYGPDGTVALALSHSSSSAPSGPVGIGPGSAPGSGTPAQKRGRGRPRGSGRKQQLASFGEWVAGSAGMGFTPHVITIAVGEDIATKIMSFSQQGPRVVCILSANGAVSTVTLRQSGTSAGTVTYECNAKERAFGTCEHSSTNKFQNGSYEAKLIQWFEPDQGRFEILCLSGSYMMTDNGGSRSRTGGLSISLSNTDGRVIGGSVAGVLVAATPVQVIVGSFIYAGPKAKKKAKASSETNPEVEQTTFVSLPNPNLTTSPIIGGWSGPRQLDMRNAHIDIDLTRGYRVGDVLRVSGFKNKAPQFKFVRWKNVILSVDADKTDKVELQAAVSSVAARNLESFGASLAEYTSCAETGRSAAPGHYVLY